MTCPLCEAEELTEWYYEDDLIYVCDCLSCGVPMAVIRRHDEEPTEEERRRIEEVVEDLFGKDAVFRGEMRSIPDHFHDHVSTGFM